MSTRLNTGGRLIDRSAPRHFTFNGRRLKGFAGDTLASALLASDQMLLGRSFKYHRPRGLVGYGAEEPNALLTLGREARHEPNQRATTTELFDGLEAVSQNHWPSLDFDLGSVSDLVAPLLPAGFYYKTFMAPRAAWRHVFEPLIRRAAGLGKPPKARDGDRYEHFYAFFDVVVVGGGIAGLQSAQVAGAAGAKVLVMEQSPHWGGRAPVDGGEVDGMPCAQYVETLLEGLRALPNVVLRRRMMGAGVYDHGYILGYERSGDHQPHARGPRHRLWRIRARRIITATGAIERPLAFAGNDVPGVMLASAVRDYLVNHAVSVGDRVVVVTNNDDAYRTAIALKEAGLEVPAVLDARTAGGGDLATQARHLGLQVAQGKGIASILGARRVRGVVVCAQAGEGAALDTIECDAVAMSGGWSAAVHLWSHCGGKLAWSETQAQFYPDQAQPPTDHKGEGFVIPAGAAAGAQTLGDALGNAVAAGGLAARQTGHAHAAAQQNDAPPVHAPAEAPLASVWMMPHGAPQKLRRKAWLDYQNDVKVSDLDLAAQEGFESVEHAKRYTTLGMATDQGKMSNINGIGVLSHALDKAIPDIGTTTFRPPYTPISLGAIAGEAQNNLFQPLRESPLHRWHLNNHAVFEPVGQWRRPYCYAQQGESHADAVKREILQTRGALGLLDASTLGKLLVAGADAGRFLDMLYTNSMSTLRPGACRYGLMCDDNGFVIDDGVVARLAEGHWLCHTTTGGAERIHAWMEHWLQCEWWDWQVQVVNLTEHYAQIAVVGPNARKVLQKLGGMELEQAALPFMAWKEGVLGGFEARLYRISFSGELSYEIAVAADEAPALWEALLEAGREFGVMPYGTEALHVMRAEKGFIMIGDETDGTVIPQDLNMSWAIGRKKADYLGKRAQARAEMTRSDRWKLVGLQTLDGSVLPEGAYIPATGFNANGQRKVQGRVTSTYYSPTLGRGIAMALLRHGPNRLDEVLTIPTQEGASVQARVVDPVFYDKEGHRQNV